MRFMLASLLLVAVSVTPVLASSSASVECRDGMAGQYPCSRVDLMAFMPAASIGGGTFNDVWGWTDPETGREYAVVGRFGGTSFVDITDPANPVYLGELPTRSETASTTASSPLKSPSQLLCHDDCDTPTPEDGSAGSAWRDAKVFADHAFIVSEESGHGMQVFDLRRLRDVADPPVVFDEDAHYGGFGSAHNIELNVESGMAYAIGSNTFGGGPHFVDVSDPRNPEGAGGFAGDGYTHDAQCVIYEGPDQSRQEREICFNSNQNMLTVLDVTDRASPSILSRSVYPRVGYTHQGWLSEDQRWFYLNDELDARNDNTRTRTVVWDVSNLSQPQVVDEFYSPGLSIAHNNYVRGDYLYQSNYTSGLRILDISQPDQPVEYAFLDSQPLREEHVFRGSWSNFPWFESGTVVFTDIQDGLFVVRPRLPENGLMEADLVLTAVVESAMQVASGPWEQGARVRVQVENKGPFPATGVELLAHLPAVGDMRLASAVDGDCDLDGRLIRCRLGEMLTGETMVLDLDARNGTAVDRELHVSVTSDLRDPDMGNNRARLILPRAELRLPFTELEESGSGCSLGQRDPLLLLLLLLALAGVLRRRGMPVA